MTNQKSNTVNLITGGAGFLGSHLIDKLMEKGEEVICVDNFFTGTKKNLIQWLGWIDDIKKVLLETDILCLPSYREGASKIVMEAQALSRPIITTNAPGCKDLVKNDYNGYICKVKNHRDLYDKMKKFIHLTIEQKMIMSKNAYLFAINNFNEENVINKYLKILRNYEK